MKNEAAAELLAELIEPAALVFGDEDVRAALKKSKLAAIKTAMKKHGKELVDILAIVDGADRATYQVNAMQIVTKTIALLSDKELISAFTLQEQTVES